VTASASAPAGSASVQRRLSLARYIHIYIHICRIYIERCIYIYLSAQPSARSVTASASAPAGPASVQRRLSFAHCPGWSAKARAMRLTPTGPVNVNRQTGGCKKRNRPHTQTHHKNSTTHDTTRTTPQQHNTRHDKNNTPNPQKNTSHKHLTTLEGGATTVRATSHARVGGRAEVSVRGERRYRWV